MPGPFLNHYRLVDKLGVGGMGEVYRAEDTKLKRQVAIKVVPEDLARDEDLMERFEREARILASLNHPNVASIYELVEAEGRRALVLELVEGPTLFEYLAAAEASGRAGLPLEEALALGLQIAEGLEAAHERGIVHRDLKPANIKLTAEGQIKILDFGLGKSVAPEGPEGYSSDSSGLVTLNRPTTRGMILGTAAYMPPEQARGKNVDKRADIWSFGVVLYEMITGVRMFEGETVTDVLAAVIGRDPDWDALPRNTPAPVEHLLRRCIERDAKLRLRDIGEARVAIENWLARPDSLEKPFGIETSRATSRWRVATWIGAPLIGAALAFFAGTWWGSAPRQDRPPVHARVTFPDDVPIFMSMRPSLALAPDGSRLVVVTRQKGVTQLYQRSLAEETAVPIRGTEDGSGPFFSSDGRFLGFFAEGKLKKVSSEGGTPITLADAPAGQGASFASDGSIIFNPAHGEGLLRVPRDGGPPEVVTTVDRAAGEAGHHWPHVLPDGKHFLMTVEVNGRPYSEASIVLVSLETKEQRVLVEGGSDARYVPTSPDGAAGHLVYWTSGDLWAVEFDADALEARSAPFPVRRGVMAGEPNGFAQFAFSNDGRFVSIPGPHPQEQHTLTLFDRSGTARLMTTEQRAFENPRISPDGRRLAVNEAAANDSLWVLDLDRGTLTRMTFDDENRRAVWSPSGDRLAFTSHAGGSSYAILIAPIDGSRAPEVVRESDRPELPESWTAAADALAFTRREPQTGSDVWVVPLAAPRDDAPPSAFLNSRFEEGEARFSYDGRWLAYQSDESGTPEIYVRAYPGPGGKRQVSVGGGTQPRWRRDGRELYFRRGESVMAVDVSSAPAFEASLPRVLFEGPTAEASLESSTWDALPDGQGFVFIQDHAQPRTTVDLVMGWFDELRELQRQSRR